MKLAIGIVLGTATLLCAASQVSGPPSLVRAKSLREVQLTAAREQYVSACLRAEHRYVQTLKKALPLVTRSGNLDQANMVQDEIDGAEKRLADWQAETQPRPRRTGMHVVRAMYGANDTWVDLTDQVRAKVNDDGALVMRGPTGIADPLPGVLKTLVVELEVNGQTLYLELRDRHECWLGPVRETAATP